MRITKKYVVNANILTVYNLLNNYYSSSDNYSLEIKKQIYKLLKMLIKNKTLEKNSSVFISYLLFILSEKLLSTNLS